MSQNDGMKMRMLYGVNQADACQAFALGDSSKLIQQQLRDIGTRMIRLFLYDKGAPDPVTQWPIFVSYVEAVLNVGATPMITFAKMHKPVSDLEAVDEFANRALGRRRRAQLVLVRLERAEQRVDQRASHLRTIPVHL
jgi:hypothetical protein